MASSSEIRVSPTDPAFNEEIPTEIGLNISVSDVDVEQSQYQATATKASDSIIAEFHHSSNPNSENKTPKYIKQGAASGEQRRSNKLIVASTIDSKIPSEVLHSLSLSDTDSSISSSKRVVDTPLSCSKAAQTEYDFKQMKELLDAENFETLRQKILRIDSSGFNRLTLDHFDFIAGITFFKLKQFKKANSSDTFYNSLNFNILLKVFLKMQFYKIQ